MRVLHERMLPERPSEVLITAAFRRRAPSPGRANERSRESKLRPQQGPPLISTSTPGDVIRQTEVSSTADCAWMPTTAEPMSIVSGVPSTSKVLPQALAGTVPSEAASTR